MIALQVWTSMFPNSIKHLETTREKKIMVHDNSRFVYWIKHMHRVETKLRDKNEIDTVAYQNKK